MNGTHISSSLDFEMQAFKIKSRNNYLIIIIIISFVGKKIFKFFFLTVSENYNKKNKSLKCPSESLKMSFINKNPNLFFQTLSSPRLRNPTFWLDI